MTAELFDMPESLSPKLRWMARHGIKVKQDAPDKWTAWRSLWSPEPSALNSVTSNTEENALFELAVKTNLQLWNESEPL